MNCRERRDDLLVYAAGWLEAESERELREHLAGGCSFCAGQLAEARATLEQLPLALDPVAPRPAVRERLLAHIATAAPVRRGGTVAAPRPPRVPTWLTHAAAAAMAAAATWVLLSAPLARERDELLARLAEQGRRIEALETETRNASETLRLLRAPELQMVGLASQTQPDAWGRVLWDRKRRAWQLYADGLRSPGAGRTYELWLITADQRKVPAGTFDPDPSGRAAHSIEVPPDIGPIVYAAVTDEPAGGVAQPTGTIHLLGQI